MIIAFNLNMYLEISNWSSDLTELEILFSKISEKIL